MREMASLHKSKHQHVDLSGVDKKEICEVHKAHPTLKHEELA